MGHASHWFHGHQPLFDRHQQGLSDLREGLKTAWVLVLLVIWCLTVISIVSEIIYPDAARALLSLFL